MVRHKDVARTHWRDVLARPDNGGCFLGDDTEPDGIVRFHCHDGALLVQAARGNDAVELPCESILGLLGPALLLQRNAVVALHYP